MVEQLISCFIIKHGSNIGIAIHISSFLACGWVGQTIKPFLLVLQEINL